MMGGEGVEVLGPEYQRKEIAGSAADPGSMGLTTSEAVVAGDPTSRSLSEDEGEEEEDPLMGTPPLTMAASPIAEATETTETPLTVDEGSEEAPAELVAELATIGRSLDEAARTCDEGVITSAVESASAEMDLLRSNPGFSRAAIKHNMGSNWPKFCDHAPGDGQHNHFSYNSQDTTEKNVATLIEIANIRKRGDTPEATLERKGVAAEGSAKVIRAVGSDPAGSEAAAARRSVMATEPIAEGAVPYKVADCIRGCTNKEVGVEMDTCKEGCRRGTRLVEGSDLET